MKKPSISLPSGFRGILSKKTISSLPPNLSSKAISLLSCAYPEKTISSSTKLSALYSLWLSQKKSEGKLLKESTKMMADIQRLHYFEVQKGIGKPAGEKVSRRSLPVHRSFPTMAASTQLHGKLARLGITDRNTVSRLEKSMGRDELESRVDSTLEIFAGREPIGRHIFSKKPEMLVQSEDRFFDLLDGFKSRMGTVDKLRQKAKEKSVKLPAQYDYLERPEILLSDKFLYDLWSAKLARIKRG